MATTRLIKPDAALRAPWQSAVDEFGDDAVHGSGFWDLTDADRRALTPQAFTELVADLVSYADPSTALPEDRVHCDYFWMADEAGSVVGFLALRHSLNDWLLEQGGHIGYSVRPSRRRQGHATRALALALARAAELGLERALVTCDEDNLASAATIEANGGVLEDVRETKRRYWVATVPTGG